MTEIACTETAISNAKETIRRELSSLDKILSARLDGMDKATQLLADTVNRTPTAIQTEISHLRELINEKLGSLGGQAEEKFKSIELQFTERDVRAAQGASASSQALAAALQAAKEAVFEQAQAAAKAAEKTELSVTKQIDQIQLQIKTIGDGFSDRISELKERFDRGEGSTSGAHDARSGQRLDTAQWMQGLITFAALITIVILIFKKGVP